MSAHGRMYPETLSLPVICFDNLQEALEFHKDVLGEVPIIKATLVIPIISSSPILLINGITNPKRTKTVNKTTNESYYK